MGRYKEGDRVRVKSEEFLQEHHEMPPGVVSGMYEFAGREITLSGEVHSSNHDNWYGHGRYWWHEDWLDPVCTLQINSNELEDLLNG